MRMGTKTAYDVVNSRYGALTVFANDTGASSRSLATYGEWAENEISFLQQFITNGSTVLDLGAYIGTHTLAFSRFVGANGRVIAVEPQPDTFELLRKNVDANVAVRVSAGQTSMVQLENAVASSRLGQISIPTIDVKRKDSFGSASLVDALTNTTPVITNHGNGTHNRAYVRTITIDSLSLEDCELIKIDVEGVEDMVLHGAVQTLERCSPIVYCECNSLAGGLRSVAVLESIPYKVFAHVVNAFNPDNFFNVHENIFGNAREVALVAVPVKRAADIKSLPVRPVELLLDVEDADDLALALLNKPQYQGEVLRSCRAAKTGGVEFLDHYDASKLELERLQSENAVLQRARAEERHAFEEQLEAAYGQRAALLKQRDDTIAQLRALSTQRDEDIARLQASVEQGNRETAEVHVLLSQRDDDIARLQAELEEWGRQLAQLHVVLTQRHIDVSHLQDVATQRDREIDQVRDLLTQRDAEIARLVEQRTAKDDELARTNEVIHKLYASRSWKVTKPLRWASQQIRDRRGRWN